MEVESCRPPVCDAVSEAPPAVEVQPPPVAVAAHGDQGTQTQQTFTFTEADLVGLLVNYEYLVEQGQAARSERCSHEPALVLARRMLRAGRPVPRQLPTQRPLQRLPVFYDHVGEPEWEDYPARDSDDELTDVDVEDLLLNTSRDLTDEEMARVLNV